MFTAQYVRRLKSVNASSTIFEVRVYFHFSAVTNIMGVTFSSMYIFNVHIKYRREVFMLGWGEKVAVSLKAKCDTWTLWLKCSLETRKMSADTKFRSVWSDWETATFLNLIHETNINTKRLMAPDWKKLVPPAVWIHEPTLNNH